MSETGGVELQEAKPTTAKDRVSAVFKTLRNNPHIRVDAVLAAGGAAFGAAVASGATVEAQMVVSALFGGGATLARPIVQQEGDERGREEAIRGDWGSYGISDKRHTVQHLVDAWRTGKPQLHAPSEGRVDGMDAQEFFNRK